jgi:hypothetical protein
MGHEPSTVSRLPPALSQGLIAEPGDHPHAMPRHGREELLEVRPREADRATLAEMKAPNALRKAARHPRPERLGGCERGRLLTLARRLARLVVRLRPDRALPWGVLRCGAYLAGRTGATGGLVKAEPQPRSAGDLVPWRPLDTRMPLGPVRLLRLPSEDEGLQVIAVLALVVPAVGPQGRPAHIALGWLRRHQEGGSHLAAVAQVRTRSQVSGGHSLDTGRPPCPLGCGRRCCPHLGNQSGVRWLTGLAEGQRRAPPWRVAFRAGAGLALVG